MTYLIIADWDENNRPTSINTKETLEETTALVDKLKTELNCPNAFYISDYNGMEVKYCIVDGVNKTISYDTAGETQDILDNDMQKLRTERDRLLTETDYLALSDTTLTSAMTTYRQALRDLPATVQDVANPIYPEKPVG